MWLCGHGRHAKPPPTPNGCPCVFTSTSAPCAPTRVHPAQPPGHSPGRGDPHRSWAIRHRGLLLEATVTSLEGADARECGLGGGRCSLTQGRRKAGLGVCGCDAQTGHTGAPTPTGQSKGPTSESQPSWPDSSARLGCEPSGQVTSLSLSFSNCKTHRAGGPFQSRPTGAPEAPCRPVCPLETVALTSPWPLAEPRVHPLRDRGPGPLGKAKHEAHSRCLTASGVN